MVIYKKKLAFFAIKAPVDSVTSNINHSTCIGACIHAGRLCSELIQTIICFNIQVAALHTCDYLSTQPLELDGYKLVNLYLFTFSCEFPHHSMQNISSCTILGGFRSSMPILLDYKGDYCGHPREVIHCCTSPQLILITEQFDGECGF